MFYSPFAQAFKNAASIVINMQIIVVIEIMRLATGQPFIITWKKDKSPVTRYGSRHHFVGKTKAVGFGTITFIAYGCHTVRR